MVEILPSTQESLGFFQFIVVHAYTPSIWKVESGGSKLKVILSYLSDSRSTEKHEILSKQKQKINMIQERE